MSDLGYEVGRGIALLEGHSPEVIVAETDRAAERIAELMPPTPLFELLTLSSEIGVPVIAKYEGETPVHSFKIRGAYNLMEQLSPEEHARGVVTASAGNHAQGVAYSAQRLGIGATVVMPNGTPLVKVKAVEDMGAKVELYGDSFAEAYERSLEIREHSGGVFVHPFEDERVIVGQSTVAKELLEQDPTVTHVFIPVGGGGLAGGMARYIKTVRPDIYVVAVEQEQSCAMKQSLEAGYPITLEHAGTFAEGTSVSRVGDLTFGLASRYIDEVITVTTDEISTAAVDFMTETKRTLEPAGALANAGALKFGLANQGNLPEDTVFATVCTGANADPRKVRVMIERDEGTREALLAITLPEKPRALLSLCENVINGHNITEFSYRLNRRDQAHILVGLGIKSRDGRQEYMDLLAENGYASTDLSESDFAKDHLLYMFGGASSAATNEHLYEIEFPERPGSLLNLLKALSGDWNISLFHYRGEGGDMARVAIGFEAVDSVALEVALSEATSSFRRVSDDMLRMFF